MIALDHLGFGLSDKPRDFSYEPAAQAKSSAKDAARSALRLWPRQVYAPYFETWTSDSIPVVAAKSGARFFSLAFLQTVKKGSCALTWNGTKSEPVPGPRYRAQIAALRRLGGDVMPTFGGFSADSTGTEIADSCTSVGKIAADYERVIASYHVTRLDMDVEVDSLGKTAAIDRRNKAIALVEAWARHHGRPLRVEYTLPVEPTGLEADALHVLQNAVVNGARNHQSLALRPGSRAGGSPPWPSRSSAFSSQRGVRPRGRPRAVRPLRHPALRGRGHHRLWAGRRVVRI